MSSAIPLRWEEVEDQAARLRADGKYGAAEDLYRLALNRFPGNLVLLNGLGLVLLDNGKPEEAKEIFEAAVQRAPGAPALVFNLGNALKACGNLPESIRCFELALSMGLDRPEVRNNLGVALQECDRWSEALEAFTRALELDPQYLLALANAGHALIQLGRPEEALPPLRSAVALQPGYADAHWLLSHALLVTGKWPEGWDEYEWRWHRMKAAQYHHGRAERRWKGEDLEGKTILLYAEQGMGDAVQFIRYAPLVEARGATVAVECRAELVPLLQEAEGVSVVHARGGSEPRYDVACPLLSLPSMFRTTLETIPASVPYLRAGEQRVALWRQKLEPFRDKVCAGLVWAGNAGHANDRKRSVPFEYLGPLASVPGVQFFSVQKGSAGDPRCMVADGFPLIDWTGGLQDFADTAALISELDLVITVDTAVAHVAGALGVEVWMLVPSVPDWRWLLDRSDSPWYPSMQLFRQPSSGGWHVVVDAVRGRLQGRRPRRR